MEDKENDGEKVEEEKSKELKICAQCNKKIEGKFLLRALDQFWHEECLKCSYCNTQLSDLSFKFYIKGDQILCKRDYIRLFGATGICSRCLKIIPPLEMVMRAREHVYHLDCFACHVCRYRFCVGDRFYLYYNTIRCQDHYYGDRGYFYQTPFFWWLKGISVSRVNSSLKLFLSFQDHHVKQQGNWDQVWLLIRFLNVFLTKIGNPLMRSQSYEWVLGLVLFSKFLLWSIIVFVYCNISYW